MTDRNKIFNNYLVNKPWGEEYTIFYNKNKVAITLVKIKPKQGTSLHCHPKKKTGFIILKGSPFIQIGIHKKNTWKSKPLAIMVLRPGLFHSIKNLSNRNDVVALEFETPYLKNDLIRFEDNYGRQKKGYETKKFMAKLNKNYIRFSNILNSANYSLFNKKITIQTFNKKKRNLKFNDKSVCGILDGKLVDNKNNIVLTHGEIIKTKTLKILIKKYKIFKSLKVLNVI